MAYEPIENYGVIGDLHTVALVGMSGSIDWLCIPHFDSPAVFAAILDDAKGGRFQIAPRRPPAARKQFYWPDTNVLVTRFFTDGGVGEVVDYMPVGGHCGVVREVRVIRGSVDFRMECRPAFNYARDPHEVEPADRAAVFRSRDLSLALRATEPVTIRDGAAFAEFTLDENRSAAFVFVTCVAGAPQSLSEEEIRPLFRRTVDYWHDWLGQCTYTGRWREMVHRSALALKLMTFEPTGAIVAAPTASLPEHLGGVRNWDYRYTWIRDAAFTLYGLLRVGFTEAAANFMDWIAARCREENWDGSLQVMYTIDGSHSIPEETLDHFEGYRGSRPVRIGNAAHKQLQLDIYGELMDAVYLYNKHGAPIPYDLWTHLRKILNWVCANWKRADEGIWEVRGPRQEFVYSRLMCWVALDRGLRLAEKRSFPADHALWLRTRDEIYQEIMDRGWNERVGAFVQAFDGEALDASNLIMPLVFFVSPTDPRMLRTLEAIRRTLVSSGLVYRYDLARTDDGLPGGEGTFNMCSFWLVEALTRAGRLDEARLLFEQMLGYANHLGLYAEQTGPHGEALGNFPQAFTHLALISAAYNLDRSLRHGTPS
jgi:GH15 family glucan-1,4-alpha-glucosidase